MTFDERHVISSSLEFKRGAQTDNTGTENGYTTAFRLTHGYTKSMIGIMMLDTRFPRIEGDIGNAASFDHPVTYLTIERARVDRIVRNRHLEDEMIDAFVQGAILLEQQGARVIGTSCGFMAPYQETISRAVKVPVLVSALVLMPFLRTLYGPDAPFGVLTFDADNLQPFHFNTCFDQNISIQGLPKYGELFQCITNDQTTLNRELAQKEVLEATDRLLKNQPDIRAIIIECTNISPYKAAIRQRTGLNVFDLVDALQWML